MSAHTGGGQRTDVASLISFYYLGPGDWIQLTRLRQVPLPAQPSSSLPPKQVHNWSKFNQKLDVRGGSVQSQHSGEPWQRIKGERGGSQAAKGRPGSCLEDGGWPFCAYLSVL